MKRKWAGRMVEIGGKRMCELGAGLTEISPDKAGLVSCAGMCGKGWGGAKRAGLLPLFLL